MTLKAAQSIEELFPLIASCKAGDLKAVEEWIEQGKPLDPPPGRKTNRRTPLQIAIERGFLTLAEMLLDGGASPEANGCALTMAVRRGRLEIAKMLLDRGTPVDSVSFTDVCYSENADIVRLFLERGADPVQDDPLYHGLISNPRPLVGILKELLPAQPELQDQADSALRHFAKEGNSRSVGLLIWAGARPDAKELSVIEGEEMETGFSALEEAVHSGNIDLLKQLKPQNFPSLLPDMLGSCWLRHGEMQEYVMKLCKDVDFSGKVGERAVQRETWHLKMHSDTKHFRSNPEGVEASLRRLEFIVQRGGKWVPQEEGSRMDRSRIRDYAPETIYRFFQILRDNGAITDDYIKELIRNNTMKVHLGDHYRAIYRMMHPPAIPENPKNLTPIEAKTEKPLPPKRTVAELKTDALDFVWEVIRKHRSYRFWRVDAEEEISRSDFLKGLHLPKDDEQDLKPFLVAAVNEVSSEAKTFALKLEDSQWYNTVGSIVIERRPDQEWRDVLKEAWAGSGEVNPNLLSRPALQLLDWIIQKYDMGTWRGDQSFSYRAGLRGKTNVTEGILQELSKKLGEGFSYEVRGKKYGEKLEFRVFLNDGITSETEIPREETPDSLNPIVDQSLSEYGKREFDYWKRLIHDHLLSLKPHGEEYVYIFWVNTIAEAKQIFPHESLKNEGLSYSFENFWEELPLHPQLQKALNFERNADEWYLAIVPKDDWESILAELHDEATKPSFVERFGLSEDAAMLLEWIEGLHPQDFTGPWTPIIEEANDKRIGLKCPWSEENFSAYIKMLVDEINEKTCYDLSIQPWRKWSDWYTRLAVTKRNSSEGELICQIQLYGLQQDVGLKHEKVRMMLNELLSKD